MFAIIETGGKQYKVEKDAVIFIEKVNAENKSSITFDKVLLVSDNNSIKVGNPTVAGASVTANIIENVKNDKVVIFKKRRRKNYRRKTGHRQVLTKIKIDTILV